MQIEWANPVRIIFGVGQLDKLGETVAGIGKHALIVTGKSSTKKSGVLDKSIDMLKKVGITSTVFNQIEPNPRAATIDKGGAIARKEKCDFVIGLGGGSAMDAAKVIALVAVNEGPIWHYVYHGDEKAWKQPSGTLPIVTLPTLAATGSEANCGSVVTNWETNEKCVIFHPVMYPKLTIIDPVLTVTVPRDYTGDGGIDIISHVLETYFSSAVLAPLQDRISEGIVRTVMQFLGRAMENGDDIEAREHLQWASTVALCGLVNAGRAGTYPLHLMEHALSAHYDISHGRGLAILMPHLMRFTAEVAPAKYAQLAKNLFFVDTDKISETEGAEIGISKFEEWMKSVNMYLSLSEVGIGDEKFEQMADDVLRVNTMGEDHIDNARPLYKQDIIKIFKIAV